ncbi:hypothetical protein EPN90_03690 [Patescibacteria group bacterium]|nr:MAG: hypothetical protein EPN90_03690 [Patescibacteria group bacterium]
MLPLPRAIIRTLCFADVLDMALTPAELHRTLGIDLGASAALAEVYFAFWGDRELREKIVFKNGFVALAGREELIAERLLRLAIAEEKWSAAQRALRRLRHLPWLRLAAVCNTVAMGLPRAESDIDIFLAAAPGRLWALRLLSHLALALGSLARRGGQTRNRICLSFSVTRGAFDLSRVAKQPADPYLTFWLSSIVPALDCRGTYEELLAANRWSAELLPNCSARALAPFYAVQNSRLAVFLEFIFSGRIGRNLEIFARRLQRQRILANPESRVHEAGTDVVVTDEMLKFHEQDRRAEIRDAFLLRAVHYGV